ncbi:hypothetical protein-transmembrane prediction [Rhodopirellula baltica SH 1]|uniref:Uncharacterized protein n=1 Tax=Rhodopirellula baltica (strain DSM 10527 / NCIMB 13988 / SH1) TaxID=243090 RepID=Q7UWA0_RHOBA|nr:hypothetical protein-transmembrane prediction [Rhodopirellula baltica SH 1]
MFSAITSEKPMPLGCCSGDDFVDGANVFDANQFLVQATIEVGQMVWIESHLMQDRGVQVTDVQRVFDRGGTELVGRPVADAAFDSASGHPHGESVGVVVSAAAVGVFRGRLTSEFATPNDQGFVQHAGSFQIGQQRSDGLVSRSGVFVVVDFQVTVGVPVVVVVGTATVKLDEPNTALSQTTCEQAAFAEGLRFGIVHAVHRKRFFGLVGEVDRFRCSGLHSVRQFIAGDSRSQGFFANVLDQVTAVGVLDGIDQATLQPRWEIGRRIQIENRIAFGAEHGALISGRHVTAGPVFGTADGTTGRIEHHDEARHVLVFAAQPIRQPRSQSGRAGQDLAAVHHQHGGSVNRRVRGQ